VKKVGFAVLTAVVLVMAIGCGGGEGMGIKGGDKLVVTERIERARFDAAYGESAKAPTHNDGAIVEIPAGTVMEVFTTPRKEAKTFEVIPIKVITEVDGEKKEITDPTELTEFFVPERFRDGRVAPFLYYTFSFDAALLGSSLKKMD